MSDTIADKLAEHGFTGESAPKSYQPGEYRVKYCPSCKGGSKHEKQSLSLKIDQDGGATWKCHRGTCGFIGNVPGRSSNRDYEPKKPSYRRPAQPKATPRPGGLYRYFEERGISRETVDLLGVYLKKDQWFPQTEKKEPAIVFPFVRDGELINLKYRSRKKYFTQEKGAEPILWNLDSLVDNDQCIFVEGEIDVMTLVDVGYPGVVTLPVGADKYLKEKPDPDDKRFAALRNCEDELAHIEKFIIAGDMDEPGQVLAEELARRLGKYICWRVTWPEGCKDANDTLLKKGAETVRMCIDSAEPWPIKGLIRVGPGELVEFRNEPIRRGLTTGFKSLDPYYTVARGQMTVVTGIPGHGKSELVDAIMVNMAMLHGWKFAVCSPEHPYMDHTSKLAEKYIGQPFYEYGGGVPPMDDMAVRQAEDWVRQHFHFILNDDDNDEEPLTLDYILERYRAAVRRFGIDGGVIDPYNEIEHMRSQGLSETEYVSEILSKIRRFDRVNDVHTWFVAHPAKLYREKSGKVPVPGLYDISGSAHWSNKPENGLAIYRPTGDTYEVEVYVHKVKFKWIGKRGMVKLIWDKNTGRYRDEQQFDTMDDRWG